MIIPHCIQAAPLIRANDGPHPSGASKDASIFVMQKFVGFLGVILNAKLNQESELWKLL
jgi:hypothetical protein